MFIFIDSDCRCYVPPNLTIIVCLYYLHKATDNTSAHRRRNTVQLRQQETPDFISPDMWPALIGLHSTRETQLTTEVVGWCRNVCVQDTRPWHYDLKQFLVDTWASSPHRVSSIKRLVSGCDYVRAKTLNWGHSFNEPALSPTSYRLRRVADLLRRRPLTSVVNLEAVPSCRLTTVLLGSVLC